MDPGWKLKCINPFNKDNHPSSKNLSDFPIALRSAYPLVPENAKICFNCRVQVYKLKSEQPSQCDDRYHKAGVAVLEQIKKKFSETVDKQIRIQLLTLAPDFWSRRELMKEFGCTEWEARQSIQLVSESGVFSIPEKKTGKLLPVATVNSVKTFYERDDVSRIMPGLKDYISVKQDNGKREHVQKRLLLADLNDIYGLYKKEHEHLKIGFTKFTQLRPPHCVVAGSSGTHNVCVCVHHENVKLMLDAIDLESLTKNTPLPLKNYHDCIDAIVCDKQSDECYLVECLDCPNMKKLRKHLIECLENNEIFQIKYESWFQTDRCTIASKTVSYYEFMDILGDKLMKLKTHDFFAKKQFIFTDTLKKNLEKGEFVVCCDYAENYAFVIQNSTQSFHWNNNQATVFTVVVYYKGNDELEHVSMAIISDNLNHDSISVYEYQKIVISYLKANFTVNKIYYLTDGAAQHFKNKTNFQNLLFHEKDFGVPAEWHFYATAHGKGACDGIGANIKRGARRASLQVSSRNHILTPEDLFNWAKNYCKETKVFYSSKESYEKNVSELKLRLEDAKTVPGTLQYHAVIPIGECRLKLKKTSLSCKYDIFPKETAKQKKEEESLMKPVHKIRGRSNLKITDKNILKIRKVLSTTKTKTATKTKNIKKTEKITKTKNSKKTIKTTETKQTKTKRTTKTKLTRTKEARKN